MKLFAKNSTSNIVFFFLSIALCILLCGISFNYYNDFNADILQAQEETRQNVSKSAILVNKRLQRVKQLIDGLANDLSTTYKNSSILMEKIRKTIFVEPLFSEVGYCFKPYSVNSNIRLDGRALKVYGSRVEEIDVDKVLDYTREEVKWFHQALEKGAVWTAPFLDYDINDLVITYSTTINDNDSSNPVGVLYMNLPVSKLQTMLHRESFAEKGYSFILSGENKFILHPKRELAGKGFFSFYNHVNKEWLESVNLKSLPLQSDNLVEGIDPLTQKQAWICHDSIPAANWILGSVTIIDDTLGKPQVWKKRLLRALLLLYITIIFAGLYISGFFRNRKNRLIFLASLYSSLTVFAIIGILAWSVIYPDFGIKDHKAITNKSFIHKFKKEQYKHALDNNEPLPLFVPTGIYIQYASFVTSSNVSVKGYIWQKYFDGIHDDISRGFILPEAKNAMVTGGFISPEAENATITETYRKKIDGGVLIGWQFNATLNQHFNYKYYPFQGENIWIQLWHKDFSDNIILVPDLDSYKITSPHLKAGLLKGLGLTGWKINSTFFSYKRHSYQTNFGIGNYSGLRNFPELYFNILIKKSIISPLISNVLPITIILIMLFTVLLLSSKESKDITMFGYNTMAVIGICGGFFLVMIFAHISLRKDFNSSDIIYLEYFYFIAYFMLLFMSLNSLIFSKTDYKLFRSNNLILKVVYWPLAMLFTFGATFVTYYIER